MMRKITVKISKLVLLIVVVCGGCITNASSGDTAKDWGNIAPNSNIFQLPIISRKQCIRIVDNLRAMTNLKQKVEIASIGAFFPISAILIKEDKKNKIGIRVIPYIINNTTGHKRYLIPNYSVSKYYPACKNADNRIALKHLAFYPLIVLKVDNQTRRDILKSHLKKLSYTSRHFAKVHGKATTMGKLFQKIFRFKQVNFLKGLPFNVCVELIDEANKLKPPVKFNVINDKKLPLPCNELPIDNKLHQSKLDSSEPPTMCVPHALNVKITQCQEKLESANREIQDIIQDKEDSSTDLKERIKQNFENNERLKKQLTIANSKIASLQHQLNEAKREIESSPEILRLENELKNCQAKTPIINQSKISGGKSSASQHKLIVVSLSKFSREQQKALRESLIAVLSGKSKTLFTLFTIHQGRQLYELLSSDELPRLPRNGKRSIRGKIEQSMQFGASDLRALDDLGLVDSVIQEKGSDAVGNVLYLTDNIRLDSNDKPPSKPRGVPLAWHEDGISLTVLTTKECGIWETYMKAQCSIWRNQRSLEPAIKEFLQ